MTKTNTVQELGKPNYFTGFELKTVICYEDETEETSFLSADELVKLLDTDQTITGYYFTIEGLTDTGESIDIGDYDNYEAALEIFLCLEGSYHGNTEPPEFTDYCAGEG